jgi:hypothetical protein
VSWIRRAKVTWEILKAALTSPSTTTVIYWHGDRVYSFSVKPGEKVVEMVEVVKDD